MKLPWLYTVPTAPDRIPLCRLSCKDRQKKTASQRCPNLEPKARQAKARQAIKVNVPQTGGGVMAAAQKWYLA